MENEIQFRLTDLKYKIAQLALNNHRDPNSITLLAVSKKQSVDKISQAIDAGQFIFGENYIQEAIEKMNYFKKSVQKLTWHLIGPIQSNKTALVATHFDWVQTLDRIKIAERLNVQRPIEFPKLNVLIQINIDKEPTKSGIWPEDLISFAEQISVLDRLFLRGLMIIPKPTDDFESQFECFEQAYSLFEKLKNWNDLQNRNCAQIDTLSMGMSDDFAKAINAGSTMIRLGQILFGTRT